MEEFMEHEEEFEARQSISSRGRDTRVHMMPGQNRATQQQPQDRPTQNYQQNEGLHDYGQGEGESDSVITEIVDEQVVELESGDELDAFEEKGKQDEGINQYLDNIKQEDYVNHDEYQEFDDKDDNSPYRQNEGYDNDIHGQYEHNNQEYQDDGQYEQEYIDKRQQEYQQQEYQQQEYQQQDHQQQEYQEQNYQQMAYQNNMMENSPIAENPLEEEITGSPQYDQKPRAVNPKYRRKYEGVDLNDKSHLVWEQERRQRKKYEREMRRANMWAKPYNTREIDWNPSMNPKKAPFNPEKQVQRSNMWHFAQSSSVPMLSTVKGVKSQVASKASNRPKFDPSEAMAKRDHNLNNVFHQSTLQNMLTGKNNGKVNAPSSHTSMLKENGRAFMTPADNKYQNQANVMQGRERMFHSSQIF